MEDCPFATSPESEDAIDLNRMQEPDPFEIELVRSLWKWCASSESDPHGRENAEREFVRQIDGLLRTTLMPRGRHPAADLLPTGLWLDGIAEWMLDKASETLVTAAGMSFWAAADSLFYLAPFECEFHFAAPYDPECSRIIVRFGELDRNDQLVRKSPDSNRDRILKSRPETNSDWAFAVELS